MFVYPEPAGPVNRTAEGSGKPPSSEEHGDDRRVAIRGLREEHVVGRDVEPERPGWIRVANFSALEVVAWAVRLPVKAHTPPVEVLIVPPTVPLSVCPSSVPSKVPERFR